MEAVNLSPQAPPPTSQDNPVSDGIGSEAREFRPLYEKFGAQPNERTDRTFSQIWEWAKSKAELKDRDSVMWEVSKLVNRLGSPGYGQKPWINAAAYVSTHSQMLAAEKRMKEMEAHV